MKRSFQLLDESINCDVWKRFPKFKEHVDYSSSLETKSTELVDKLVRTAATNAAEFKDIHKPARLFVRHEYVAKSIEQDRDHFLLTIEGHILDNDYMDIIPFSSWFKKISIQVDRKSKYDSENYEWISTSSSSSFTSFQAKIPNSDNGKPFNVKITLIRNLADVTYRYEVSSSFLSIFPNANLVQNKSVSEEEIMSILWSHIQTNNLLEGRDNRRTVKCDPLLCRLFGIEYNINSIQSILLSSIKTKLLEMKYLVPIGTASVTGAAAGAGDNVAAGVEKICFDYYLNSNYNTVIDVLNDTCCCPSTIIKNGGKSFDMEVYMKNNSLIRAKQLELNGIQNDDIAVLHLLTNCKETKAIHATLDKYYHQCHYIARQMNQIQQRLDALTEKETDVIVKDIFGNQLNTTLPPPPETFLQRDDRLAEKLHEVCNPATIGNSSSVLHTLNYVDVGDSKAFNQFMSSNICK